MAGIGIQIDVETLQPLIAAVVTEVLKQLDGDAARLGSRLAWGEAEAAELLGLQPHQLRDERRRGRIKCSQGPGKLILYSRENLLEYLAPRQWQRK